MRAPWIRFVFLIAFGGNHYGRWIGESFKSLIKISFGFNLIYQVILVGNWDQEPFLEFLRNVYP